MERRRRSRWRGGRVSMAVLAYCASICIFSVCTLCTSACSSKACLDPRSSAMEYSSTQGEAAVAEGRRIGSRRWLASVGEKGAGRPGSSPPRCAGKCGDCTPCSPVHVSVPPGTAAIAEYYPVAWRCKCGSKLYMP